MKKGLFLPAFAFVCLLPFWSGCRTVPETGRKQLSLVSDDHVEQMALSQFAELKQTEPLSRDPEKISRAERIGRRIAAVVDSEVPPEQWEFVVFESEQINAFALPGGKVGIYTGLMDLADSDDEIAAVVGHEVAHVQLRHGSERVSQNLAAGLLGLGVAVATRNESEDTQRLVLAAYGIGATVGVLLPYSRVHESEADRVGLLYAARAGYDPRAAITFWQKMEAREKVRVPEFLSTHPSEGKRIERLEEMMPEALEEYEKAKAKDQ